MYVGDADSGTELDVCIARFQLAYLGPEALRTFKQAARATRMTHHSDVIVIAYHAGTKPGISYQTYFTLPPPPFSSDRKSVV